MPILLPASIIFNTYHIINNTYKLYQLHLQPSKMNRQPEVQITFQTRTQQISYQKTYATDTPVQKTVEVLVQKEAAVWILVDMPDQNNVMVKKPVQQKTEPTVVKRKIITIVPAGTTETITDRQQYLYCPPQLLDQLEREGHKNRTDPIRKRIEEIQKLKYTHHGPASEDSVAFLRQQYEELKKQMEYMKSQIHELRACFTEIRDRVHILEKHIAPKDKIQQKLANINKKSRRFIYIRCMHRSLNSFFQSVLLSRSDYLQVKNPHEYYFLKNMAQGIASLVKDIPVVSTIFNIVRGGLTFVLEAHEQQKLRKTKAKVDRLVSIDGSICDESEKLSLSLMDSLINISGLEVKEQEMIIATENPRNLQFYSNLSWIQKFQSVYKQLKAAIVREQKQKSRPDLTSLYADCDYAKVMKRLFDSKEQDFKGLHDLLTQAIVPSGTVPQIKIIDDGSCCTPAERPGAVSQTRRGEDDCCACM